MEYYALGNVVYTRNQEVVCIISPVWLRKYVANLWASKIANSLNNEEADSRDVLRGSLD